MFCVIEITYLVSSSMSVVSSRKGNGCGLISLLFVFCSQFTLVLCSVYASGRLCLEKPATLSWDCLWWDTLILTDLEPSLDLCFFFQKCICKSDDHVLCLGLCHLKDFRFYRYTLPVVTGLMVDMEARSTCIKIPKARHSEVTTIFIIGTKKITFTVSVQ